MLTQHLSKRRMQQMRRGMIERDRLAALLVDLRIHGITHAQLALVEHSHMGKRGADFLRVAHGKARIGAQQNAGIADLAAALRVERRVVQHNLAFLARPQHIDHCAIENQRGDPRRVRYSIVAREIGLPGQLDRVAQIRTELARRARPAALRVHGGIEARLIDAQASLARHVGGQIGWKSIGVIKTEHRFARNHR